MDVVINSQIQSPLVRTLARTKGKSQSFTHNIADNVAPCSFTKIQLSSQNQGETQFGRNYKLKIPQYGYLRDIILKYTTEERPIDAKVVEVVKPLYTHYYTALEDVRAAGSFLGIGSNPNAAQTINSTTWARSADITWYNAQNIVRTTSANGYDPTVIEAGALADVASVLVPQFGSLFTDTLSSAFVGNNGVTTGSAHTYAGTTTSPTLVGKGMYIASAAGSGPYMQLLKLNGTAAMWSSHFRLYYSIYKLAMQSSGGVATYPLAKAVWNALQNEPVQTVSMELFTSIGVNAPVTVTNNIVTGTSTLAAIGTNVSRSITCTMPKNIVAISRGGQTFWIPKIPQLRFDANGSLIGVDFVPLHLLHPNDNGDSLSDIALISKLSSTADSAKYNYRQFPFGAAKANIDDWSPWDWQSESFYYQGIAANVAERVQLSTHNRPIQTVFPQETYARIQQFAPAERARYLKMMEARISQSGKATGDANGRAGQKVMYFPLLLSSTENPSMNFDTRFVEQLDIDVMTNAIDRVFTASDVIQQASTLRTLDQWFEALRVYIFNFDWKNGSSIGPDQTIVTSAYSVYSDATATSIMTDLTASGAVNDKATSFGVYNKLTPRSFVLSLRSFQTVPQNYIKVEALAYFHNFHDATSQAIRDSNFKVSFINV